jgi:thiol-disulfide isomerase/thioredoxin
MRARIISLFVVTGALLLTAARAQDNTDADLTAHSLKAQEPGAAWSELAASIRAPVSPKAWENAAPTPQEARKYYQPYFEALVDRLKDFYTRFPKDSNAFTARLQELKFLTKLVSEGDTSEQARLDAAQQALVKDPTLPKEQHYALLWNIAQSAPADKARPYLQQLTNTDVPPELRQAAGEMLKANALLGQRLDLAFTAVDGRAVDLSRLQGKVVLVDFWATWCPPCRGEVPNVRQIYEKYHAKGFEIVGISLDNDKDSLQHFVAENKMEWPQYFDGLQWKNKYARQFGIESIPTMWLVDKTGKLREMNAREDLAGNVEKLLAE